MYQPKFNIGQEVYSKEYGIEHAVVCGIKIYFEIDYEASNMLPITLEHWLDHTNNCDYDLMSEDMNGVLVRDCLTERFLEEYNGE